jgi:hypothetical protein
VILICRELAIVLAVERNACLAVPFLEVASLVDMLGPQFGNGRARRLGIRGRSAGYRRRVAVENAAAMLGDGGH